MLNKCHSLSGDSGRHRKYGFRRLELHSEVSLSEGRSTHTELCRSLQVDFHLISATISGEEASPLQKGQRPQRSVFGFWKEGEVRGRRGFGRRLICSLQGYIPLNIDIKYEGCLSVDVGAPAEISHEKEMTSIASSTVGPPEGTQVVDDDGLQVTCFTEDLHDVTIHFQIIRLKKQIYAWIGCNTAKFGHLYAAAPTRPNNTVSVTSILGGTSDNTGSSIARRLVLKTGLSIILACNIPKNSPILEADAERKLIEKLTALGYTIPKSQGFALSS